jgi:hypothetical protein
MKIMYFRIAADFIIVRVGAEFPPQARFILLNRLFKYSMVRPVKMLEGKELSFSYPY